MKHAAPVRVSDCTADRFEHFSRHSRRNRSVGQSFGEIRPFDQLHAEVGTPFEFTDLVDVDDIRMM